MIKDVLVSLKEYLGFWMPSGINVTLDSVKKDKETGEGDLVITLLRIEEETSRKPQNVYLREDNNITKRTSPDIDLNLEVLISAPTGDYGTALHLITMVVRCLNSIKTTSKPEGMTEESYQRIRSTSISLMGLSFDQSLSMWQTLGATLVPAVAYKIRMFTVPGLTDEDAVHIIGEGKIRVEAGKMDTKGKKPVSVSKQKKETNNSFPSWQLTNRRMCI